MSKDQLIGVLVLLGSLALLALYGYMIYVPDFRMWALIIVATVAVVGVLGIMAWIGWVMATTPPPAPLEEYSGFTEEGETAEEPTEESGTAEETGEES
ncbi:MAG: transcriptional regulator [Candidatus Bathyarchaeia archaeon]